MKQSELFFPTLFDEPKEATLPSHRHMLRAGLIRPLAAGIYSFLPLGYKMLQKIEKIVRKHMQSIGAQEVLLPALHPKELWEETGRWEGYGEEMFRLKDRRGRSFGLGPTHEEVITDIVRRCVRSYKELPLSLFQIQTKFRDEPRPRGGLIRCREFLMKDAYSFDKNMEDAEASYNKFFECYCRVLDECGLNFFPMEAEAGIIGGIKSHEFMAPCAFGEDLYLRCTSCDYAASKECAKLGRYSLPYEEEKESSLVYTPSKKSAREVAEYLLVEEGRLLKTLIYKIGEEFLAFILPGDRQINETKIKKIYAKDPEPATAEEVKSICGVEPGFAGPIGLKIKKIADNIVREGKNWVIGANKEEHHIMNANLGRDFEIDAFHDITVAKEGDPCPLCNSKMREGRGIEVAHVFLLGTKYSEPMKAFYRGKDQREHPIIMGCYGIGISRILSAIIEQRIEGESIILPPSIAPFDIHLLLVAQNEKEKADILYERLKEVGYETLYDERDISAGKKFFDAEIVGIPKKVIIGKKLHNEGKLEIRKGKEIEFVEFIKFLENPSLFL